MHHTTKDIAELIIPYLVDEGIPYDVVREELVSARLRSDGLEIHVTVWDTESCTPNLLKIRYDILVRPKSKLLAQHEIDKAHNRISGYSGKVAILLRRDDQGPLIRYEMEWYASENNHAEDFRAMFRLGMNIATRVMYPNFTSADFTPRPIRGSLGG